MNKQERKSKIKLAKNPIDSFVENAKKRRKRPLSDDQINKINELIIDAEKEEGEEYRNIVKPLEEEGLIDSNNITKETALIIRNIARPIHGRINRTTSRSELIERYKKVKAKSKEDRLLERYILAANSVFNFVNEHQLDKLDQEEVEHLRTIVGKINDILNPFNTRIIKEVKNTRRRYDNV